MTKVVTQEMVIRNRGAELRTSMLELPSRDLLQLDEAVLEHPERASACIPAGTLWRSNRDLARMTRGSSTHARYDDLYDLLRAGTHIVRRYGAQASSTTATESGDLREDIETARRYVQFVLAMNVYLPEEKSVFRRVQSRLVLLYETKRSERKATARERFLRGLEMKDRTGRENRPAAALVTGAGIGHLLERVSDVRTISTCIDRRSIQIFGYIRDILELYQELWAQLAMDISVPVRGQVTRMLEEADTSSQGPSLLDRERGPRAMAAAASALAGYRDALTFVSARPFCRNAAHTIRDLDQAIALCERGNRAGARTQMAFIRRGIRWVFVLHALQMDVIAPLAYLLDELTRAEARRVRASGMQSPRRKTVVSVTMAPSRFAEILTSLESFLRRMSQCSDEGLAHPVKDRVERFVRIAQEHMARDEWLLAKQMLIRAAKLL